LARTRLHYTCYLVMKVYTEELGEISWFDLNNDAKEVFGWSKSVVATAYPINESYENDWVKMISNVADNPFLSLDRFPMNWENLKHNMLVKYIYDITVLSKYKQYGQLLYVSKILEPYFKLIDFWAAKGYKIKTIIK
jgi:hypothetical protein